MLKLLIVEDNYMDREGLIELIDWGSFGFGEVYFAKDGQEGLEKAREIKPELVLSDISMPRLDGLSMAGKIQSELPDVRFIFMSCFEEKEYMIKAIDVNAYGYILKPIQIEQLSAAVEKVMNIVKSETEQQRYITSIETELHEYLPYVQETVLRDLCYGSIEAASCEREMQKIGLRIGTFYTLIAASVDMESGADGQNGYLYVYKMQETAQELAAESRARIVVKTSILEHKTLLLHVSMCEAQSAEEALEECVMFVEDYHAQVCKKLGCRLFVSIGDIETEAARIPEIFKEVKNALDFEISTQTTGLVMATELVNVSFMEKLNLDKLKEDLARLLDEGTNAEIVAFTEQYLQSDCAETPDVYKQMLLSLVSVLQMILYERGESFERIFDNAFPIWEKIMNPEQILDMRQWIINMIKMIAQHLDKQKKEYYNELVENIKALIQKDYAKFENVSEITESFYISKNHLNLIFKRQTGENIFDYLMKTRIYYAKQMLADTDMRVYEISEKIGYKSTAYFTSVFKQFTGQTPKEYRVHKRLG